MKYGLIYKENENVEFNGTKCIKITKSEYDDIKFIDSISTCTADAEDKVLDYLLKDRKVDSSLPNYILRKVAYNLYMAVMNNYRYLEIVE